jgi:hypothetical protein
VLAAVGLPAAVARADDPGGGPIMPISDVQAGMDCTGETVIQGTTITPFDVRVVAVVQDPVEGARILIRVSGPAVAGTGVAEGFSGSPVYCPGPAGVPENIGAISEGIGQFGNDVVLVTPIETMLGEPVDPPPDTARLAEAGRPLLAPLTAGGLAPSVLRLLQSAGRRAGRPVLAAPSASASLSFPVQPLVPGASVATSYSAGAIALGAIGTVTYRNGSTVYAFGHELDGAGRRSLLLQDAYVYDVIGNPSPGANTSYKLAVPGHTVGTVSSDTPAAVLGTVGSPPPTIPVDVTARDDDTGATLTLSSQVADETGVGLPLGVSSIDLVVPLEVAQAATQIFNGPPANETGHLCLTVTIRESRAPFRFCNRYVGTGTPGDAGEDPPEVATLAAGDVVNALGALDDETFATLHVTGVTGQLSVSRGLAEGEIVAAHARSHVRRGQRVIVRLRVRRYRGPLTTMAFPVRIPRTARGRLVAKISNPSGGGAGSLQQLLRALTEALGGGAGGSGPPHTIAALRKAFAATSTYDGLAVRFGHRKRVRAFRDPALLVTGSAKLAFRVRR